MTDTGFYSWVDNELHEIDEAGLTKPERIIVSPQSSGIVIDQNGEEKEVINLCANNYLGLADNAEIISAAKEALDSNGYGMASVRFICGTQDLHRELEKRIADFFRKEDTILYAACFDANGGLFEPLLGPEDAIISDALNHASIIDGVRLCKAQRYRYANSDMDELEACLIEAQHKGARHVLIATDGVFSMDGYVANLPEICDLAEQYNALVMVDDCHAAGFYGPGGRGTPEYHGVEDRVDIITGTLGKALGGAMGGYTVAKQSVIDLLKQRSRPYLFSNSLTPSLVAGSIKAFDLIENGDILRKTLRDNTDYFRERIEDIGFEVLPGSHPIIPVMLGEAKLAQDMARLLLEEGVYVTGFSFPVVPKGLARIRTQMSAAHTREQLDTALTAFEKVGKALSII